MDYIIHNGTIVNEGTLRVGDLYIRNGRLVESESLLHKPQHCDVTGCYVMPGVIDTHVHFRDPGLHRKPCSPCGRRHVGH